MTRIQALTGGSRVAQLAVLGVALIAIVAAMAFATSASAAKLGGKTTLAPNAQTLDALAANGVAVAPSGKANAGAKGISFPITRGRINLDKVKGRIVHKGGLTFTDHGKSLTVENFVIKLGNKNVLRAEVAGGGKVRLADLGLDNARIKERAKMVKISKVELSLARKAAKALSATFGLPDLTGADLGKATVKVKP